MRIEDKNKSKRFPAGNGTTSSITIHSCAETGDLIAVQRLLQNKPSLLNERSILMVQTPLHFAAAHNRVEIVTYLLDWRGPGKVELEAKNVYGETPLHVAAKNGCTEIVKMLLDYGANIEARTNNQMTSLHLAVGYALRSGENSTVKTLSEYNADTFARDDEGLIPFDYLPVGMQDHGLTNLLNQNAYQHVDQISSMITSYSWTKNQLDQINNITSFSLAQFQNVGQESSSSTMDPRNYESGIKGKMDEFECELSKIVGLHDLKQQLRKWAKGMLLDEKRRAMGIDLGPRKPPHMAFLGNPGTGKTTVARILGKLLQAVGVLSSDTVTEVQRTDLVAEYLGQTGPKTRKKIEEATGGILFVDEAYRLVPEKNAGDCTDMGVEALEEIMSVLEDGDLVVIFAGYTEPMKRVFSSNEGFCRRVTHFFQFDDFTCKDLAEMLMLKMTKANEKSRLYGFKLHPSCTYEAVLGVIERNASEKLRNKMNGGLVDHMLNNARENLDSRLNFDSSGDELLTITMGDLEAGLQSLSKRVSVD